MSKNNDSNNSNAIKNDENKKVSHAGLWLIIFAGTLLLVLLIIVGCFYVNEYSERIKFVTVNALSLLVLVIIAIQAYIYRRQWEVMQQTFNQTSKIFFIGERAYLALDGMSVEGGTLEAGKPLAIRLKVKNGGRTPAFKVTLAMQIAMVDNSIAVSEIGKHFERKWKVSSMSQYVLAGDFARGVMNFDTLINQQQFSDWEAGRARLHIMLRISYFDISGDTEHSIAYGIEYTKAHGLSQAECAIPPYSDGASEKRNPN